MERAETNSTTGAAPLQISSATASDSNTQLVVQQTKPNHQLVKYEKKTTSFALEDWFDQQVATLENKKQQALGKAVRNLISKPKFNRAYGSMPDLIELKTMQTKDFKAEMSEESGYSRKEGDSSSMKTTVLSLVSCSVSRKHGQPVVASESNFMNLQKLIMLGMKDPKLLTAQLLRFPIKQFFRSGIRYRTLINVMIFLCVLFLL